MFGDNPPCTQRNLSFTIAAIGSREKRFMNYS